jgi:hypothetical protein
LPRRVRVLVRLLVTGPNGDSSDGRRRLLTL